MTTGKHILISSVLLPLLMCPAGAENKVKFYAEVSNHLSYNSRDYARDASGTFDLLPVQSELNDVGLDLNDKRSMNFCCLSSRAGVQWNGMSKKTGIRFKGVLEADFLYNPDSYSNLRLRHALLAAEKDFGKGRHLIALAGQSWHPFAEDAPFGFQLSRHAPFNPYALSPQIRAGYSFNKYVGVSVAALWQSYGRSLGPEGASTSYIRYGACPELFLGIRGQYRHLVVKTGLDFLSIKPRTTSEYYFTSVTVPVNDRIRTLSFFVYAGYRTDKWEVRAKSTLAQSGEHLMLMSGYATSGINPSGGYYYTPYRNSASWISGTYKWKIKGTGMVLRPALMAGYSRNLGTKSSVINTDTDIYFTSGAENFLDAIRVSPSVEFTYLYFIAGLSWEFTTARYGDKDEISISDGLCTSTLSRVSAHTVSLKIGLRF